MPANKRDSKRSSVDSLSVADWLFSKAIPDCIRKCIQCEGTMSKKCELHPSKVEMVMGPSENLLEREICSLSGQMTEEDDGAVVVAVRK